MLKTLWISIYRLIVKKMKLIYITRVDICSTAAQAIQIRGMCDSFYRILGNDFALISAGSTTKKSAYKWIRINCKLPQTIRYAIACLLASYICFKEPKSVVYTRDIAVALTVALLGGKAVYEAHKQPVGKIASILFMMSTLFSRFNLVTISDALSKYYQANYKKLVKRIFVAPLAIDSNSQTANWKERERILLHNSKNKKYVFLHTGSLYKGGAEIFEDIIAVNPKEIRILHVGGTEKEVQYWNQHYRSRNIRGIKFIKQKQNAVIRKLQKEADFLLYVTTRKNPIYWCTSPLKIFEYMLSGSTILGARIGAIKEILNEQNSYCFEPESKDSISLAVQSMIETPHACLKKARKAYEDVIEKYDIDKRSFSILRAFLYVK